MTIQRKPSPEARREPVREFFKLSLLAQQINHPQFKVVKSLSFEELYHEAKHVKQLAFHQFHGFIAAELDRYTLLKTKNADPDRFLGREDELEEYAGVKLFFDVKDMAYPLHLSACLNRQGSFKISDLQLGHSVGLGTLTSQPNEREEAEQRGGGRRRSRMSYVSMHGVQPAAAGSFREPPIQIAIYDIDKDSVSSVSVSSKSAALLEASEAKKKRSSSTDFPKIKRRQTLLA